MVTINLSDAKNPETVLNGLMFLLKTLTCLVVVPLQLFIKTMK